MGDDQDGSRNAVAQSIINSGDMRSPPCKAKDLPSTAPALALPPEAAALCVADQRFLFFR